MRITEVVVDQLHALEHRKLLVDALEGGARHRNSLDAMLFFWDESASVTEAVVKCMQFRPILMSFLFFEKSFSLLLVFYSFFLCSFCFKTSTCRPSRGEALHSASEVRRGAR